MFWSAGCSLLRAGGFFCNLDVHYGGLEIGKLQFFFPKKHLISFSAVIFFQVLVIKTWIRIGSGSVFSLKSRIRIRNTGICVDFGVRITGCRPPSPFLYASGWQVKIIWTWKLPPPPPPTGIGERYCQTIPILGHAELLCRCNFPCKRKCWTNSGGPLVNSLPTYSLVRI